ncbi:GNAT family N-acetyltransferase [Anaerolineales bacterium]
MGIIKLLEQADEIHLAIALQETYWQGLDEKIAFHMLWTIIQNGGHLIGAFEDDELIAILVGLVGFEADLGPYIASKRMVVSEKFRGTGLGYQLKLFQKELAMQMGFHLVRWTFDPLLAPNAYLNFHKLGATSTQYKHDYYGKQAEGSKLLADRFVIDWWIRQERETFSDTDLPKINFGDAWDGVSERVLLQIPLQFLSLDKELQKRWRLHIKTIFLGWGYFRIVDFLRLETDGYYFVQDIQVKE